MIIGNFFRDAEADTYVGGIMSLTFCTKVELRPVEKSGDKEPDYRIVAESIEGSVEVGAAWKRRSERGQDFLSVSIDDPAFSGPLNAAMFPGETEETAVLVWNRKKTGKGEASEAPRPGNGAKTAKAKAR